MPSTGPDERGWFLGTETTVNFGCRGPRQQEEDMFSSDDDFILDDSDNSVYVTTNETSSGNCIVGSLSSDTSR